MTNRLLAIVSGGIDSVTMAYRLKKEGWELEILSFAYGQRHLKELQFAERCAEQLDARFDIANLISVGNLLENNSITGDVEVPAGVYSKETIKLTVVPNRNAIMLAVAFGIAASRGYQVVAIGVHSGDHPIYADCSPKFIKAFEKMIQRSLPDRPTKLLAPYLNMTKAQIVAEGASLDVFYEDTWSCYKGGAYQCGVCSTCVERKEAFRLASVEDPTRYLEPLR